VNRPTGETTLKKTRQQWYFKGDVETIVLIYMTIICTYIGMRACVRACVCVFLIIDFLIF